MIGVLIDLLSSLFQSGKSKALAKIVPRLKHTGFVDAARRAIQQQAGTQIDAATLERQLPLTRPFAGDLVVAYAIDGEKDYRFVGRDFLEQHKLTLDELHAAALANGNAGIARGIRVGKATNFMGVESLQPGMAANVALYPQFWKPFEDRYGPLLVTIPGRDFLSFLPLPASGPERDKALVQGWLMKSAATAMFDESANHALSAHCFLFRNGRFEVREELGQLDAETAALLETPRGKALLDECAARVRA